MKVLITGGAGFLGRAFLRYHLGEGDEVTVVDDMSSNGAFWIEGEYERIEDDLLARVWSLPQFDIAYHFAAPVGGREKIEGDPLFNAESLAVDSQFFRWAVQRNVGIVVYPSSSAVYGVRHQRGIGTWLTESMTHPSYEEWDASDEMYGFTKFAGEMLAWKAAKYGLNTLCLRPFSGYGPEQSMDYPVPSIVARAVAKENPLVVWGSGDQRRDFVHIDDVVGATISRLNAGVRGYSSMNICSGISTSFVEVARVAAVLMDYDPDIVTDAAKPEGVFVRVGDPTLMNRYYKLKVGLVEGIQSVIDHQATGGNCAEDRST